MRRLNVILPALAAAGAILAGGPGACAQTTEKEKPRVELKIDPRVDEPTYYAGVPIPFALRLMLLPPAKEASVPAGWYRSAKLEWRSSGGEAGEWKPVRVVPSAAMSDAAPEGEAVKLTAEKRGDAAYLVIPPEETSALKIGRWVLRATLEVPVAIGGEPAKPLTLEDRFDLKVSAVETPDDKMRVSLLQSRYSLENSGDIDVAIRRLEEGLRESGSPALYHHVGWLYVRKGELRKGIEAFRKYIAWARASGIPRVKCCGRDVQEIADELEQAIPILEKRLVDEVK